MTSSLFSDVRRRGASAVELAAVLPVLLALGIGCVETARAITFDIALANAARIGAEHAATHRASGDAIPASDAKIRAEVEAELVGAAGYDAARLTVSIERQILADGMTRVTVDCAHSLPSLFAWPGLPAEFPLRHSLTVHQYR